LRDELPVLLAKRDCIVVYATTEPSEALLFGGNTATMHEGRITQFGPTNAIYRAPRDLISARVFSDPPINTVEVMKRGDQIEIGGRIAWPAGAGAAHLADGPYTLAIRPHHISPSAGAGRAAPLDGRVIVTELSGSESVIHFDLDGQTWVSQSHGIHPFEAGATARLYVDIDQGLFFGPGHERVL
jgi:glycerol transport system ATP-binding protein